MFLFLEEMATAAAAAQRDDDKAKDKDKSGVEPVNKELCDHVSSYFRLSKVRIPDGV